MIKNYPLFLAIVCALTILPGGTKSQVITSVVGTFTGDGYSATSIGLNPVGEVVDAAGNMYIAVPDRHVVLKLSSTGIFTTIAGTGRWGGRAQLLINASDKLDINIAADFVREDDSSSGFSSGPSIGVMLPRRRRQGGTPTCRCRSELFWSTTSSRRSFIS